MIAHRLLFMFIEISCSNNPSFLFFCIYTCIITLSLLGVWDMDKRKETILMIIWTQSLVAVIGSLFFSEIMGYVPCEICWFQRILMYPLVIIYGTALVKKDINIALPGLFLRDRKSTRL